MTDFLVTSQSHGSLPLAEGESWQDKDYSKFEREINLKNALVNLLRANEGVNSDLSHDNDEPVSQRSLDLLVWLMNLELRLNPYGDPA